MAGEFEFDLWREKSSCYTSNCRCRCIADGQSIVAYVRERKSTSKIPVFDVKQLSNFMLLNSVTIFDFCFYPCLREVFFFHRTRHTCWKLCQVLFSLNEQRTLKVSSGGVRWQPFFSALLGGPWLKSLHVNSAMYVGLSGWWQKWLEFPTVSFKTDSGLQFTIASSKYTGLVWNKFQYNFLFWPFDLCGTQTTNHVIKADFCLGL